MLLFDRQLKGSQSIQPTESYGYGHFISTSSPALVEKQLEPATHSLQ